MNALVSLAALGPTGVKRPCKDILKLLAEEREEFEEAYTGGNVVEMLEEAGDMLYYASLLEANDCGNVAWNSATIPLAWALFGNASDWHNFDKANVAMAIAAIAKWSTRFIVNRGRKDKAAERAAIAEAVEKLLGVSVKEE